MDVVFWLNSISLHQAPLVKAVSEFVEGEVVVVSSTGLPAERLELGWHLPEFGPAARVVSKPSSGVRKSIEREFASSAVHIVSGAFSDPGVAETTRRLTEAGAVILCQTEGWDSAGLKGAVRQRVFNKRFRELARYPRSAVLAMGSNGLREVESAGFPRSRIAEFGYFVDVSAESKRSSSARDGVVFVGGLRAEKRIDDVLKLAGLLPNVRFTFIGDGPQSRAVNDAAATLTNVEFVGVLANHAVRQRVAKHKILVLPSRHDGWGAVVNEALAVGTMAVCSDRVGAGALLETSPPSRGLVFPVGDLRKLRTAVETLERNWEPADSDEIAIWSADHISPERGAQYLVSICSQVYESGAFGISTFSPPWRGPAALEQGGG